MNSLIPILISAVAIATLLNVVLKRFNMPTVIGYIFTGAILAVIFDLHIHGNKTLEHIAELSHSETYREYGVGVSIGLSQLQQDDNFKALFKRADQALYKAKHNGKHQAVVS